MFTKRQIDIITTSINLIANKGIQGFTIRNLSSEVGVTESAIYRHFKSKVSILCAILEIFEQELQKFITELKGSNKNSIEKIMFIYQSHIERFMDNPAIASVLFSEEIFKHEIDLVEKSQKILDLNENNFEKIIEEGQKNNEIRQDIDSSQLALISLATIRLSVKMWVLNNYSYNLKIEGDKIADSIKKVLTK